MRRPIRALAGLSVCALCVGALDAGAATKTKQEQALAWLAGRIRASQHTTWHWQHVMGMPVTPTSGVALSDLGVATAKARLAGWERRAAALRRRAEHPPHLRAFLCIHRYEGSWRDGGGPYYGGLQMDVGFQAAYGRWLLRMKGTADHWTPLEQIWTAEKALRSRGFWPWPNTARACGLL